MKNYFKLILFFLIFIILTNCFIANSYAEANLDPTLILNYKDEDKLPMNFRKTTDLSKLKDTNIDLVGLDTLNISGSSEFTTLSLKNLLKALDVSLPITVIDLRQESHGFINGNAVSYYIKGNRANAGLTLDQIIERENNQLAAIPLGKSISIHNDRESVTLVPKTVQNESSLTKLNNLNYFRIPVLDNTRPTDEMVDRFITFVNNTDQEKNWLHFHCDAGDGRTTLFMVMYDIMKNSNNIEVGNIIKRQALLGGIDFSRFDRNDKRLILINNFYQYARDNEDNFNTPWTEWVKENNIEPYTLEDEKI